VLIYKKNERNGVVPGHKQQAMKMYAMEIKSFTYLPRL
jgi:hypothetical protein